MFAADDHAVNSPRALPSLKHLHHSDTRVHERHSSPYCCWSLWWISADATFSPTRNLITMRCSTLRGTFCSLITLATPRQDWTGSNLSRREGGRCGFTVSRSHSCCAVRLVHTQISPGHIWTTLYNYACVCRSSGSKDSKERQPGTETRIASQSPRPHST